MQTYLYAGGGVVNQHNGEIYDPRTGKWITIASMRTQRRLFTTAVMDDKIFAIGGIKWNTPTSRVECFDKRTNNWFVCLLI
jgi:kelch-like protein 20